MTIDEAVDEFKRLVDEATKILILQADNPDGDSLGSAIALEQILMLKNKQTDLFCAIKLPSYLSYMKGWDRVSSDVPDNFDLCIIVDTSAQALIENATKLIPLTKLSKKPLIVIDHHITKATIDFANLSILDPKSAATGEVIYKLSKQAGYELNQTALDSLTAAILSDTLGLTTDNTTSETVYAVAEMVEKGVSLSALESARRSTQRKSPQMVKYKGQLLERIEYFASDRVALLVIPWEEIEKYSPEYNPAMLALDDMRLTTNTQIAIVLKIYPDGKITGKIRSNHGSPLAAKLAENFGGGGNEYASGFKLLDNEDPKTVKNAVIAKATELLDGLSHD